MVHLLVRTPPPPPFSTLVTKIPKADKTCFCAAAAYVAGQATQLLGLPDISDEILDITDLRSLLLDDAYVRVTEKALYNGAPV